MPTQSANPKLLRAGNACFGAAALLCLCLAGFFTWGRFILAESLQGEFSDSAIAAVEAAALSQEQQVRITYEIEAAAALRNLLRLALRIGQSGFLVAFLLMVAGYLLRRAATRAGRRDR